VANKEENKDTIGKLVTLLSHTILSVENIDKMVVVRTITAAASTAAEPSISWIWRKSRGPSPETTPFS